MPHDRLDALLDLLALDGLPRSGWVLAGVQGPESIAAHGLGAVLVALAVGPSVEPPVDVDRVASLCAVHDAPEAWLGDIPRRGAEHLPAGAKHAAEDGVADRLLGALSPLARERFTEFQAGDTREARLARLCDKLHLGLRLLGYVRAGVRGLDGFRPGLEELDCSEFPPCDELRGDILARLDTLSGPP
ncbi:MAG: HD domain-containing protein [Planctomycetota bacterium]|nr:HD domain-containing protein [Planctomycetota bacterium]